MCFNGSGKVTSLKLKGVFKISACDPAVTTKTGARRIMYFFSHSKIYKNKTII